MTKTYKSFWMGGFEGADHVNANKHRLDMVRDSGHLDHITTDYQKLTALGIKTVRESIGWRTAQPTLNDDLDLSRVEHFAAVANEHGIQVIWTFMHYGTPEGVSLLANSFIDAFVAYAIKAAKVLKPLTSGPPIYNLINEIGYLAWVTSQTDHMWPYQGSFEGAGGQAAEQGYQIKCRLVQAVLKAMDAIKQVSSDARFLHVEPLLHIVAPEDRPDLEDLAQEVRDHQWQTWELLKGSMEPHLGGHLEALDLMGVNYYYNGQMEVVTNRCLDWEEPDARRAPFSRLLKEVWSRYQRPLIIAETGHFNDARAKWLNYVLSETEQALKDGVPLEGLCIYPVVDRPCWHEPNKIVRCGIIDIERTDHHESIEAFRLWRDQLAIY